MKHLNAFLLIILLSACGEVDKSDDDVTKTQDQTSIEIGLANNIDIPNLALEANIIAIALDINTREFAEINVQTWEVIPKEVDGSNHREAVVFVGDATTLKRSEISDMRIAIPNTTSQKIGFKGPVVETNNFTTLVRYETVNGEEKVTRVGSSLALEQFETTRTDNGIMVKLSDSTHNGIYLMNIPDRTNTFAIIKVIE